jgi:hypothetical protein
VREPVEGLMTTYGFAISNPSSAGQLSIWWTGGSLEVKDANQVEQWKEIFKEENEPKIQRPSFWKSRLQRAKDNGISLSEGGIEEDGKMKYEIIKPHGGHNDTYVNVLYMDEALRIMQANTGPIYVSARIPVFPDE